MRSGIIAAVFAVGALAVPYQKREYVTKTDVDVVYVTDVVTVTGKPGATPQAVAPKHFGHHEHHHHKPHGSPQHKSVPHPSPPVAKAPSHVKSHGGPARSPPPKHTGGSHGAAPSGYSGITVFAHNLHRQNHSAPNIEWDDGLASTAAAIAASCVYAHNVAEDGGGYGQNIAAGVKADNISAIITDLFYNNEVNWYNGLYGEANPSMVNFEQWGHFSQIVWKATTHVGCATQDCSSKGLANVGGDVAPYFTVCNYKSPGNFAGEYGQNVLQPLGHPTAQWNTGL